MAVESEAAALVPGYVNRPGPRAQSAREHRLADASQERGLRSSMRIARVALRAYEQRVERRAALRDWIAARAAGAAPSPVTS